MSFARKALIFVFMVCSSFANAEQLLTEEEFRLEFMNHLEQMGGVKSMAPAPPTDLELEFLDGTKVKINLANAYQEYIRRPDDKVSIIERFILAAKSPQKIEPASLKKHLVVILRPEESISELAANGAQIIKRPFAGDLFQILAIDSDITLQYADQSDLDEAVLTGEEAWKLGYANIKTRMGPVAIQTFPELRHAIGVIAESGLAPSMLVADRCSMQRSVVLVFSKEAYAMGVLEDKGSMKSFWKFAKKAISENETLSQTPLECMNGEWIEAVIP